MILGKDPLAAAARSSPDTVAVIDGIGGPEWTYRQLDQHVTTMARGLAADGVESGDVIVLPARRDRQTIARIHAIWRLGGVVCPLDPGLSSNRLAQRCRIADADGEVGTFSDGEAVASLRRVSGSGADPCSSWEPSPTYSPESVASILFTSGTTGSPTPVTLTHRNLTANAIASAWRLGVPTDHRWWSPLAPYHMGGFAPIVRAVTSETGILLAAFETERIAPAVEVGEATGVSLVPTMLRRGLEPASSPLRKFQAVLVGGDRTPPELVQEALAADVSMYVSYGATEAASQIATATPKLLEDDPGTVGHPLRWTELRIEDEDGTLAPDGRKGRIAVRGPSISPSVSDSQIDGWWRTGDFGRLDSDGRLQVTGRTEDRIISGGVTIDPHLVADVLRQSDGVQSVAVVGVPDREWGERVVGVIEPTDEKDPDLDGVKELAQDRLRPGERPKDLIVLEQLPRTPSGTVDRTRLREIAQDRS